MISAPAGVKLGADLWDLWALAAIVFKRSCDPALACEQPPQAPERYDILLSGQLHCWWTALSEAQADTLTFLFSLRTYGRQELSGVHVQRSMPPRSSVPMRILPVGTKSSELVFVGRFTSPRVGRHMDPLLSGSFPWLFLPTGLVHLMPVLLPLDENPSISVAFHLLLTSLYVPSSLWLRSSHPYLPFACLAKAAVSNKSQ